MAEARKARHSRRMQCATAQEAVRRIRHGQRIFLGSGAAQPVDLVRVLTARDFTVADSEIIHILTLGPAPYTESRFQHAFRHDALFTGPNVRKAVTEGRADFTPVFLSEVTLLFRKRRIDLDVALIQVNEPDHHGFCSFGVSVNVVKSAAASAGVVIAEVNRQMPRILNSFDGNITRTLENGV